MGTLNELSKALGFRCESNLCKYLQYINERHQTTATKMTCAKASSAMLPTSALGEPCSIIVRILYSIVTQQHQCACCILLRLIPPSTRVDSMSPRTTFAAHPSIG